MIAEGPAANRPPHIALELLLLSSRSFKALILGITVIAAGCDRQSTPPAQPGAAQGGVPAGVIDRSRKGSRLPDLTFTDPSGKTLRLASLHGKPLLINLWATWCAPCVAELPTLDALAAREGQRLKVLTISQDGPKKDAVGSFLKQRGVKLLEPWIDPDLAMMTHYQAEVLPTTILYDADSREVWRAIGPREWGDAESAKLIAEGLRP
jgi:thiol-disulfide isomerase/thioredoxin